MVLSTTTYSFNLPEVNSATDEDLWGGFLNTNWTNLDSILDTRQQDLNFADFELSRPELKDYSESLIAGGNQAGPTITIDMTTGNHYEAILTGNISTLTINNPPASGNVGILILYIAQDAIGSRTFTFPAAVEWAGGTAPTVTATASAKDEFALITRDGGTSWTGSVRGQDFS